MKKLFTLLLFLLILIPQPVDAVNFSLSLSPPVHHILIKPGVSVRTNFRLHNSGDPLTMQLKFAKVESQNESLDIVETTGGVISFTDTTLTKPFIMTSNQVKTVEVDIKIREDSPQKEQYFAVIAEAVPQPAPEGKTTVHLLGSVSSLLLLTIKEDANLDYSPNIALFNTKPNLKFALFGKHFNIFDTNSPIPVIMTVQNQGKNTFKAEGWISLYNSGKSDTFPLNSKYLLAESQATLVSPLSTYCQKKENEKKEACQPGNSIVFAPQKTGMYNLKASMTVGKQGKGITQEASFIVLPLKIAIAFSLITFSLPLLLLFYIRKKQK